MGFGSMECSKRPTNTMGRNGDITGFNFGVLINQKKRAANDVISSNDTAKIAEKKKAFLEKRKKIKQKTTEEITDMFGMKLPFIKNRNDEPEGWN